MDKPADLRLADDNDGSGDTRIVGALRELYAPPAEDAYWTVLENRVMGRIAEHRGISQIPVNWWSDLASWAGPGLAAAALIFAAVGLVWSRQDDEELRASYEAVTDSAVVDALPGAVQVVTAPHDGSSQREATFRYVLSH
ncbi:MAG TPA: hypothetical protein VGO08_22325 [Burkholderiales bacterium]|jgi:hypothetical protein|nr:hypothetical protein [Burkholderiales bacterium]